MPPVPRPRPAPATPTLNTPASTFTPARVPDQTETAPIPAENTRVHPDSTVIDTGNTYQGSGYVYGSPQGAWTTPAARAPGVELKLPFK